jgi:hypothetical protein
MSKSKFTNDPGGEAILYFILCACVAIVWAYITN